MRGLLDCLFFMDREESGAIGLSVFQGERAVRGLLDYLFFREREE